MKINKIAIVLLVAAVALFAVLQKIGLFPSITVGNIAFANCYTESKPERECYYPPGNDVFNALVNALDRSTLVRAIAKALPHLTADHPDFVYIAQKYIIEPPEPRSALALAFPDKKYRSQFRQDEAFDKLFNGMTNGFFIEAGAWDGEEYTNSVFFEKERNWTGLLVEPLAGPYKVLRGKHRHAFTANVCLGTGTHPYTTTFRDQGALSVIISGEVKPAGNLIEVFCMPLYTLLKAIGQKRIDYFTLDIESIDIEQAILEDLLKWDDIEYRLIDVEFNRDIAKLNILRKFMESKGFVEVIFDEIDSFFVNKSFVTPDMPYRKSIPEYLKI